MPRGTPTPMTHGGDLSWAEARFGVPAAPWLDLSTGINPNPYPIGPIATDAWHCLPDAALMRRLVDAAAECYGVADPACVTAAPGTQALIQLLPRLRKPGRAAVVSPTYSEHAAAWRLAGHDVAEISREELTGGFAAAVVVLANPNNPDGHVCTPDELLALAHRQAASGGWLVVDEAFADAMPECSVAGVAPTPGLIVLRSFGKFFGLPGARLGFAVAETELAHRIRTALGPWPVSGPSAALGARALADRKWIGDTRVRLASDSALLAGTLAAHGLALIGGTPLFQLAEHPEAAWLFEHLARRGIYVRAFAERPAWLRFGLPGGSASMTRLAEALASFGRKAGAAAAS